MPKYVTAHISSDDGVVNESFDCVEWFDSATNEDILNLFRGQLCGYYADAIAFFLRSDEKVDRVFQHILSLPVRYRRFANLQIICFEVTVERKAAINWVYRCRPYLYPAIMDVCRRWNPHARVGLPSTA
jgi:hypothetical protein